MLDKTILFTIKNNLCTGCGICVVFCPNEAIELTINKYKGIYEPKLDKNRCNYCFICSKVCPGHEIDYKKLSYEIFRKKPKNLVGNYLNCYTGHSTNLDIRYNSSSGGLITQLLIFALEKGLIDGALVTRMKKDNPLEPEPFIAKTKDEIIDSSKSKYCPVPLNIALKKMLNSNKNHKIAVVGLPCHINGIRKAEKVSIKLKKMIKLHIGIFCNHCPTFHATSYYLKKHKIKKADVIHLDYRGKGWPGYMKVEMKNGKSYSFPYEKYWHFIGSDFFIANRCTKCPDATCELSDMAFGDAWLPEFSLDKMGKSLIISRNESADNLLKLLESQDKLKIEKININQVIESQEKLIYFKKRILNARFKLLRKPIIYNNLEKPDFIDYFLAFHSSLTYFLFTTKSFRLYSINMPQKLINSLTFIYYVLLIKQLKKWKNNNYK